VEERHTEGRTWEGTEEEQLEEDRGRSR
jgi:hypothetical protein